MQYINFSVTNCNQRLEEPELPAPPMPAKHALGQASAHGAIS